MVNRSQQKLLHFGCKSLLTRTFFFTSNRFFCVPSAPKNNESTLFHWDSYLKAEMVLPRIQWTLLASFAVHQFIRFLFQELNIIWIIFQPLFFSDFVFFRRKLNTFFLQIFLFKVVTRSELFWRCDWFNGFSGGRMSFFLFFFWKKGWTHIFFG